MSTPLLFNPLPPSSPYNLELESIDRSIDVYSISARLTYSLALTNQIVHFCKTTVCSSVVIMMFSQVPDFHLLATEL